MTLMDRDAYVIAKLALFTSQGMAPAQAVNEVIRTCGFANIALQGHDQETLRTDLSSLQTAVNNITVPAVRAAVVVSTVVNKQALHPPPRNVPIAEVFHMRALSAGG